MMVGSKSFCPECESEIIDAQPAEVPAASAPAKPQASSTPASEGAQSGHVIKDGMGMIEENRTKIGAVDTFSDNSVTTHNHTTNTTNISNITQIEDDTKKSVVCEISGRKVLVTSSVVCPMCGKTVAEQYYDESKLRCALCEKKAVEAYENFYKEMTSGSRVIDKELRSVLDSKAKGYKLYVLSNMSKEYIEYLRKLPVFEYFDYQAVSCEQHLGKPDHKFYEYLLSHCNLVPSETIFIDDRKDNVEVAAELGIVPFHFDRRNPEKACEELRKVIYNE